MLAIPLVVGNRLLGVLAAEDRDPMRFGEWHEAYLEIIANQIALSIDRMLDAGDTFDAAEAVSRGRACAEAAAGRAGVRRARQAPAHLLPQRRRDLRGRRVPDSQHPGENPLEGAGRVAADRTDRVLEPRDAPRSSLGLPPVKDNLESRLILLRRRLEEKCPDLQIVSIGRGRFALRAEAAIELLER